MANATPSDPVACHDTLIAAGVSTVSITGGWSRVIVENRTQSGPDMWVRPYTTGTPTLAARGSGSKRVPAGMARIFDMPGSHKFELVGNGNDYSVEGLRDTEEAQ